MRDFIPSWLRAPRTTTWLVLAALLLIAITLAAMLGYWLDCALFLWVWPDGYLASAPRSPRAM